MTKESEVVSNATDQKILDRARTLAPKMKALADETRIGIMLLLAERARTVRDLQEALGLGQTVVSHHLTALREQELVSITPRGRSNVYSLCCEQFGEPARLLAALASLAPHDDAACCATTQAHELGKEAAL